MFYDFQTTTHGKWILAGEHTVLRGGGALVFPVLDKTLTLNYQSLTEQASLQISIDYPDANDNDAPNIINKIITKATSLVNKNYNCLTGKIHIASNIPTGVGMGASAALCVAIARWFAYLKLISHENIYAFAKNLENIFHGESSGLDIAGVDTLTGIFFKQGQCMPIKKAWEPNWQLTNCNEISTTENCINKVKKLWEYDALAAKEIDEQMIKSVEIAHLSLENKTQNSKILLKKAMDLANDCFKKWGLITPRLQEHMQQLLDKGAMSVKPTGSGGGGVVVSLWE